MSVWIVMSTEEIKALECRWFEESNRGKAAAMAIIDELHTTDYVFHSGTGEDIRGLNHYKQYMSGFYRAFPDLNVTIDDVVVEGAR
jgi:predicted ester cyclase